MIQTRDSKISCLTQLNSFPYDCFFEGVVFDNIINRAERRFKNENKL